MNSDHSHPALRPIEAAPGVLIHPTADRRLASEHWLLATLPAPSRDRARLEWDQHQVTLLPLGTLFSAVRIPGRLLVALTGITEAPKLDQFLRETLDGGPVICDPRFRRYYALVPASMPRTWYQALDDWRAMDVDCLGRGSYLGVPRVDAVQWTRPRATYWSAPMDLPSALCSPVEVARLIAAGRHCMPAEPEA
ncbi:hypothetical protein [Streptomyces purpurascens]|uniref:DNA primase/polymerase bifunctional N-terminal domain-containing protein n=1 Tax=Streptomyces purpurascens TaxID=1924 RepID=A0ABZ1MIS3_STREF